MTGAHRTVSRDTGDSRIKKAKAYKYEKEGTVEIEWGLVLSKNEVNLIGNRWVTVEWQESWDSSEEVSPV